jgi:hypothetical protein
MSHKNRIHNHFQLLVWFELEAHGNNKQNVVLKESLGDRRGALPHTLGTLGCLASSHIFLIV